jgi:hypothetical protein
MSKNKQRKNKIMIEEFQKQSFTAAQAIKIVIDRVVDIAEDDIADDKKMALYSKIDKDLNNMLNRVHNNTFRSHDIYDVNACIERAKSVHEKGVDYSQTIGLGSGHYYEGLYD